MPTAEETENLLKIIIFFFFTHLIMIWNNTVYVQQVVSCVVHLCNYYYSYSSMLDIRGGPGVAGCTLLSHEGFVDHKRAMKETNI